MRISDWSSDVFSSDLIYLNRSQDDLTTSAPSHIGMHCSLATTALGKALLAGHYDKHVSQLIWRINGERSDHEPLINIPALLAELQQGRKHGSFMGHGSDSSRYGIATLLDRKKQLLSIGLEQSRDRKSTRLKSSTY